MGKKQTGVGGVLVLFIILAALAGLFVAAFPLVEVKLPAVAEKVNQFRGCYTGPLFENPDVKSDIYFTEKFHGLRGVMSENMQLKFIPAADIKLNISTYYDNHSGSLIELYLYEGDNLKNSVSSNLNVPYAQGRQAGAFSQQGTEMPDHANWFSYDCRKGILYTIKVAPKSSKNIGQKFVVKIEAEDGWIALPELWVLLVTLLVCLFVLYIFLRIIFWARKSNCNGQEA